MYAALAVSSLLFMLLAMAAVCETQKVHGAVSWPNLVAYFLWAASSSVAVYAIFLVVALGRVG